MSVRPTAIELPLASALVVDDRSVADDVLALFGECSPGLRRYVRTFGIRADTADDVVQDVFVSLFRHLQLGRSRDNLKGWLFRVAHNQALKARKRERRLVTSIAERLEAAETMPDAGADPESQLAEVRVHARVQALLRGLPDRDRRCLYLRAEGLTYRDIARVLGVSLGTVAATLARTLGELRRSSEA